MSLPSRKRCSPSPTRPGSSSSRGGSRAPRRRAALHRRHGEGARRRGAAGHRDRRLHRLSRDARRPREDAAPEGPRRHPRPARPPGARRGAASSTASRRSTSSSSISTRSARPSRRPGCTLEDAIENIDIGGPTMVRSAAKNWHARRHRRRSRRLSGARSPSSRPAAACCPRRRASRSRARRSRTPASYDGAISNWLTARGPDGAAPTFPDRLNLLAREGAGPALRREPAPAGRVLPRRGAGCRQHRDLPAAAGQGALVQQHRRQRRGLGVREDVRRARRA